MTSDGIAKTSPFPAPRPRTVYGAAVGILMLDTRFPRLHGDVGNAETWPFPVLYKVVRNVTVPKVHGDEQDSVLTAFIEAGRELVAAGADGLTTSCGFLTVFQAALAEACAVPVAASPLLQVPWLKMLLPPSSEIGILTARRSLLTARHLNAVGIPSDIPIEGLDDGEEFSRLFVGDTPGAIDTARVEQEIVAAASKLLQRNPRVKALILECANMAPFSRRLRDSFGMPIFDIYSLITWFQAGLRPRRFEASQT